MIAPLANIGIQSTTSLVAQLQDMQCLLSINKQAKHQFIPQVIPNLDLELTAINVLQTYIY